MRAGEDLDVVDDGAVLLRHALNLDRRGGAGANVHEALFRPGAVAQGVGAVVHGHVDRPAAHSSTHQYSYLERRPQIVGAVGRAAHVILQGVGLAGGGVDGQRGGDGALRAVGGRRGRVQVDAQLAGGRVRGRTIRRREQDLHARAARRPVDDGGAGWVRADRCVARHIAELEVAVHERNHTGLGLGSGRGHRRASRQCGGGNKRVYDVIVVELPLRLCLHQVGIQVGATRAAGQSHPAERPHERHNAHHRRPHHRLDLNVFFFSGSSMFILSPRIYTHNM